MPFPGSGPKAGVVDLHPTRRNALWASISPRISRLVPIPVLAVLSVFAVWVWSGRGGWHFVTDPEAEVPGFGWFVPGWLGLAQPEFGTGWPHPPEVSG